MSKQLLKFKEIKTKGKTKRFKVYSTHSNECLGEIHWRSGWRCYVMSYDDNIDIVISRSKWINKGQAVVVGIDSHKYSFRIVQLL